MTICGRQLRFLGVSLRACGVNMSCSKPREEVQCRTGYDGSSKWSVYIRRKIFGKCSSKNDIESQMATVTQIQEATNADGQPIKLAVAYSDQVHDQVLIETDLPCLLILYCKWGLSNQAETRLVEVCCVPTCIRQHNQVSAYASF